MVERDAARGRDFSHRPVVMHRTMRKISAAACVARQCKFLAASYFMTYFELHSTAIPQWLKRVQSWCISKYQTVMASEVEPPFVSAAQNKGWLHSVPEQLLASNAIVGYAAWLLRPQALGAPVAMTSSGDWIHQQENRAKARTRWFLTDGFSPRYAQKRRAVGPGLKPVPSTRARLSVRICQQGV
jgi:hypothetical protein